jgi:regulatory protein
VATPRRRSIPSRREIEPLNSRAARVAALDALARRDHASEELRRKLLDKGYDPTVVGPLIERLRAERLVDDRRYLENFVALHAARGHGPVRVRADLHKLGVQGEQVEECVEAYPDWIVQLQRARQKKFGTSLPGNYADRRRQAQFLGYRGFTSAQIRIALGFDTDLETET